MATTIIGSKSEVDRLLSLLSNDTNAGALALEVRETFLKKKIRFPLLEHAAKMLFERIPSKQQLDFCNALSAQKEIGGNVLIGIILQKRLEKDFAASVEKAIEYIIEGDQWFVCDIIGERVMGYALLTQPKKMIPLLQKMKKHPNKWTVRCIGVAAHYAIKKGLEKAAVEKVFELLLSLSNTTEFHTKKGIGWAAKTTAKFHPDIIEMHEERLQTDPEIKQWFKTKIKIGLSRAFKYATRHSR